MSHLLHGHGGKANRKNPIKIKIKKINGWIKFQPFLLCNSAVIVNINNKQKNKFQNIVNNKQKEYKFVFLIMRLKELREKKKITQQKLAIELNMSQNTISRYENGIREADYKSLISIADYFNVSIDYLLERTDNPTFYK